MNTGFYVVTMGASHSKLTVGTARAKPAFVPLHSLENPTCKAHKLKQSGAQIDTVPWTPAWVHDGGHLRSANN